MKKRIALLLTSIIIAGTLAGCGGGSNSSSKPTKADAARDYEEYATDDVYTTEAAEEYSAEMPVMEAGNGSMEEGDNTSASAQSARKIIKTVNISAETETFDDFINTINAKVNQLGGYMESTDISGRSINSSKAQMRKAYLVARIPSGNLDNFVTTVTEHSNIINKSESAEDVTLSYADTEARIKSLRTEQERLNELLGQAVDLDTIIVLEERLTEVRYEIESYESRLRTMDNMVDYSTVYLNVTEVERYTVVEEPEQTVGQRISQGFSENLRNVGDFLVEFFIGLIISLPIIAVLLIFIAIPTVIILVLIKLIIGWTKGAEYRAQKKAEKEEKKAGKRARKYDKKHGITAQQVIQPEMEYYAVPSAPEEPAPTLPTDDGNQNPYTAQAQFMEQVNVASSEYDAIVPVNEYQASEAPEDNQ